MHQSSKYSFKSTGFGLLPWPSCLSPSSLSERLLPVGAKPNHSHVPAPDSSSVRLQVIQQGNLLYGWTNICINMRRLALRVIHLYPARRRLIAENPFIVILWWEQIDKGNAKAQVAVMRLHFLTSCVWIMEVWVQAFFQEPWHLFSAPLLNIFHKLLQVRLMEGEMRKQRKRQLWSGDVRLMWKRLFNNAEKRWKLKSPLFKKICNFCSVMQSKWSMYSNSYCYKTKKQHKRCSIQVKWRHPLEISATKMRSWNQYCFLRSNVTDVIMLTARETLAYIILTCLRTF